MAKDLRTGNELLKVRRLLRRQNTREYFRDDGWTKNPSEARCFSDVIEVAETCALHGLADVEIILCVDGGVSDLFCTAVR